eukprot:jgi/Astpho2/5577/Aster-02833
MQPGKVPMLSKQLSREDRLAQQSVSPPDPETVDDFEAVYNGGLAFQEMAARAGGTPNQQLDLLNQACGRYEAAWRLQHASHAALYNWGVALSDMARLVKRTDEHEAYQCLLKAAEKYATSLHWNANNPQALNNWGLVLQELSSMRPPAERHYLVQHSVAKFHCAVRLRPDFDRACYNLGTVLYAYACALQSDASQHLSSQLTQASTGICADPQAQDRERTDEQHTRRTFAQAAQYIMLSYVQQPSKEVYRKSLQVVQQLLPLPHLRAGPLLAPDVVMQGTPQEKWVRSWFVLDHEGFRASSPGAQRAPAGSNQQPQDGRGHSIPLADIAAVKMCNEPSLPLGAAFWVSLHSKPQGMFFVADLGDEAEAWVDALVMLSYISHQQGLPLLAEALSVQTKPTKGSSKVQQS